MPKVILFSQFPLPYNNIGSWTTLYRNYLEGENKIDIIICEKPDFFFQNIEYEIIKPVSFGSKIRQKITKKKFGNYIAALKKTIRPNEKYIIQVVDNFGLAKAVYKFLDEEQIRNQCYVQYFYHGFTPFNTAQGPRFYEKTDEMVVLTKSSYDAFKTQSNILPSRFSILNNGVNTQKFFPLSASDKVQLRKKMGFVQKNIFIWCSQDRPKKGLHIILNAWSRIHENHPDTLLLVIGCDAKNPQSGVEFLGRIPNDSLPQYYQLADVYLFSTLCLEGFGMSLTEALHCGCYCIASALGGVPEVLQQGKLGKLIENPHFISEWISAIETFLAGNAASVTMPTDLYTTANWVRGMDAIIAQAKLNFR